MARFFSKIRQRLLSGSFGTKNRAIRYFLYALGEILLVVLGILIALQVDTWNEERKDRAIAGKNIVALRADLIRDTALIRKSLGHAWQDSAILGSITRRISRPEITLDTLVYLARYRFNPWIFTQVAFHNNTYNSLLATGELKKLPESLQDRLMELNSLQEYYSLQTRADVGIYLDNTIQYTRKYPFSDVGHINPDSKLAEIIWEQATLADLGKELNSLIGVKYSNYHAHIPALEEILSKTEAVLDELHVPGP